jgi:methyl-accepting chemotaxis protein
VGGDSVAQLVDALRDQLGEASDLVGELVRKGREQTDDVLANLDQLLGKGIEQLEQLSRKLDGRAARTRRAESVDLLLRGAERARAAVTRARRR